MKKLVKQVEGFDIYFEALPEYTHPKDCFDLSVDDINEICEKIDNYELTWFCAKVTAEKAGVELATDYLGCCCYNSEDEFLNEDECYFAGMVSIVVDEAKKQLPEIIKQLNA